MSGFLGSMRALNPGHSLVRVLWYELGRWILWSAVWTFADLRYDGAQHVPREGGCLIVANHQSNLDPPIMALGCRRHMHFVAREGLFGNPAFRRLIRGLNAIPIDQTRGDTAAIKQVIERLREGHLVLLFPEGSRTPDGAVDEFKAGAALLLKRAGVPVLPLAIEGAYDVWPRGRAFPRLRGRIHIRIGQPISAEELKERGAREILEHLRETIDEMRLALRRRIRCATNGRFPRPGAGDYDIHQNPRPLPETTP